MIDGVNITNQGYGALGSYSIVFGSLGNATPFDFVKEVQVKTGGYEAEFGQSSGGVVNVITKSGTNALHGSVFGYSRPTQLEGDVEAVPVGERHRADARRRTPTMPAPRAAARSSGTGCSSSAPWIGSGKPGRYRPRRTSRCTSADGYDRERRNVSYAAKTTYSSTARHRIDASFFGDPSHGPMTGRSAPSALLVSTAASFSEIDYGGHNQTVRYDGVVGGRLAGGGRLRARAQRHSAKCPRSTNGR